MGDHLIPTGGTLTMSSREIAELVESRHDSVKRAIERLHERGVIQLPPPVEVTNHLGQTVREYQLCKRDSYVVVAQLSPEFTARLVDRWQELEGERVMPPALDYSDPAVMLGVISHLKAEAETAKAQVIEMAPKAKGYDALMNSDGLYGLQNAGRALGARPNLFIRWLKQEALFYQGSALVPRVQYIQRGYFEVKTAIIEDKARPTTFVTPKGLDWLHGRLPDEILIGGAA
jgi:phage antirepressor YoqD-like protein